MRPFAVGPINAATPTPLLPDGTLDRTSVPKLCRHWLDLGLDGVMLLGSMGEGPLLPDTVRNAFVEQVLAEVGDRLTIFVSAADLSRERMLERARRYAAMGAHCVVLCAPPRVSTAKVVADIQAVGQKYALHLLGILDHAAVLLDQTMDDRDRQRVAAALNAHRHDL